MAGDTGFVSTGEALFDSMVPGLSLLLVQILIILIICRLIAIPFGYIRQPRVIAEVIGGILLGPTALGRWKWFSTTIFPKDSLAPLSLLANIGLIFFLLLMGLELDIGIVKSRARVSAAISLAGILLPFTLSIGVSTFFYKYLPGIPEGGSYVNLLLFIGVAMSITALPVLARILTEKKLLQTPVGVIVISAAAVDDAVSWAFLALVVALINSSNPLTALYIILSALVFTGIMLGLARPALLALYQRFQRSDSSINVNGSLPTISQPMVIVAFLVTMVSSFITSMIGIHTIFGGFLTGLSLPRENGFAIALTHRLEDFVTLILLPLYFAFSGLRTDIGSLSDALSWGSFFLVFGCAAVGKIVGCTLAAKRTGSSWREAITIGSMMNTKGLVEIIVLNIGLDAGIITPQVFAIMVLMAIATTVMTTPLITWLYPPSCYMKVGEPDDSQFAPELTELKDPLGHDLNMVLAIPDMGSVSSTMGLLQYLHGPDTVKKEGETTGEMIVHGARYLPINDRMSTVLMATNESETIQRDPALNIFKTFGNLKRIAVVPHLLITSVSDFPKDLARLAYENKASMILVPFVETSSVKTMKRPGPSDKTAMSLWSTTNLGDQNVEQTSGTHLMIPSSSSSSHPTHQEDQLRSRMPDIIEQLLRKCRVKVGVFVDRGLTGRHLMENTESKGSHRILVPFFGGPDDTAAVLFALRLRTHPNVSIHILHIAVNDLSDDFSRPVVPDPADEKVLELVKALSTTGGPGTIKYTFQESHAPLSVILEELVAKEYTLFIGGHMGPRWATLMQQLAGEEANEELNNGTVWSILKLNTVRSIGSLTKGQGDSVLPLVSTSSTTNTYLEQVLGPIGSGVYQEGPARTSLLLIRKLRVGQLPESSTSS